MKFRNLLEFAGLRRKPKHFDYTTRSVDLGDGIEISVADWKHPRLSDGRDLYASCAESVRAYRGVIREGDFCIDIGAHVGDTTLPMGVAAGTQGCVLALEPNPYVYHVLERNARSNRHVANIRTLMAAAGTETGFIEFEYSDSGFCNGGRHAGIPAYRHGHPYKLEVFCIDLQKELRETFAEELDRLKLIKVDAEGYDLYVLRSLTKVIDDHRPIVRAEVFKSSSPEYRQQLFDLFDSRDYAVYRMRTEPLGKGERFDRRSMSAGGHFDILCFPD